MKRSQTFLYLLVFLLEPLHHLLLRLHDFFASFELDFDFGGAIAQGVQLRVQRLLFRLERIQADVRVVQFQLHFAHISAQLARMSLHSIALFLLQRQLFGDRRHPLHHFLVILQAILHQFRGHVVISFRLLQ